MPPVASGWFLRSAMVWERAGAALSLPFAGVHIVEASKQVYRAIPAHRERARLIPSLQPVLVPSSTAGLALHVVPANVGTTGAVWRCRYLLVPRIEIFARRRLGGHVVGARPVRAAAAAREALARSLRSPPPLPS